MQSSWIKKDIKFKTPLGVSSFEAELLAEAGEETVLKDGEENRLERLQAGLYLEKVKNASISPSGVEVKFLLHVYEKSYHELSVFMGMTREEIKNRIESKGFSGKEKHLYDFFSRF